MVEKVTDYMHDIAYYAKDSRLTEPSDGKRYEWREMDDGNSHRTLGVIAPDGEVVRTYTFNQDGFISGSQEYLYGKDMIMVTDVVYPGTWYVRLSTDQTPAEKTSVTARLSAPFVWGFASDADESSAEIEDDAPLPDQRYDCYRTYEQTKEDI